MDEEKYISQRLGNQISWYDKKSSNNKRIFIVLSIGIILSGSLIPFLAAYMDKSVYIKIVISMLGVIVSVLSATIPLLKLHKNWQDYRTTAESLKHEKYFFETKTSPYNKEVVESFGLFVTNIEALISMENSNWVSRQKKEVEKN